jgi:hypothetical protein
MPGRENVSFEMLHWVGGMSRFGRKRDGRDGKESGPSSYREAGGDNGH